MPGSASIGSGPRSASVSPRARMPRGSLTRAPVASRTTRAGRFRRPSRRHGPSNPNTARAPVGNFSRARSRPVPSSASPSARSWIPGLCPISATVRTSSGTRRTRSSSSASSPRRDPPRSTAPPRRRRSQEVERLARAPRRGAQDQFGLEAAGFEMPAHAFGGVPPARSERPVVVGQGRVVPARLRVTDQQETFHRPVRRCWGRPWSWPRPGSDGVPSAGLEPAHPAPEADALSTELRGLVIESSNGPRSTDAPAAVRDVGDGVGYASGADDRRRALRARVRRRRRRGDRARSVRRPAGDHVDEHEAEGARRLRDERRPRARRVARAGPRARSPR